MQWTKGKNIKQIFLSESKQTRNKKATTLDY